MVYCILKYCRYFHLKDPSWSELNNFMKFLDSQLFACENSIYCSSSLFVGERQGVIGFKSFVVSFMVKMSVVSLLYLSTVLL